MMDLNRLLEDYEHRSKIIETVWLFWAFVLIGFDNGILGPCLPDLQASVGASLQQISYVFFLQGTGALLGNVLGFLLERRLDRQLLMGIYCLVGSAVNVAIPLVRSYVYLLGMFFLQGVSKGAADFGAMSLCNALWEKDKALPFQFIVVGAGISTFVSPFLAQPFIDNSLENLPASVRDAISKEACDGKHLRHSETKTALMTSFWEARDKLQANDTQLLLLQTADNSAIRWPFFIVGMVTFPAALAFFYFYFSKPGSVQESMSLSLEMTVGPPTPTDKSFLLARHRKRKKLRSRKRKPNHADEGNYLYHLHYNSRRLLLFRLLVIILNIPVFGLLLTFADLLTSIGMTSPLCLTAAEASNFNTVLWGSAMLGRALSAVTLLCVPMFTQLLLCGVALVATGLLLAASPPGNALALWFGTAGVGLFATPAMPGFIAWSGDYAPITPFFMNLSLCAAGVGEMLLPFLGGQIMAALGTAALMWFTLAVMVAMLLLFGLSYLVAQGIEDGACPTCQDKE